MMQPREGGTGLKPDALRSREPSECQSGLKPDHKPSFVTARTIHQSLGGPYIVGIPETASTQLTRTQDGRSVDL